MKNKIIKKIFIALTLIFSWAFFTLIYAYSSSNITVITSKLNSDVLISKTFNQFLKGEKITGKFVVSQNYLGQLSLRFYNYDRKINDEVVFRIKNVDSNDWLYEHTYETNQFLPNELFPFGFPTVPDSKGKTYYFEIESVKGSPDDSVTLSRQEPLVTVGFQYPKSLIIKDKNVFSEFVTNKIKYSEINRDFIIGFLTYINFIFLALILEYILLKYLFKINLSSFKIQNGSYVIIASLIVLVFSAIFLYLKKSQISETLCVVGYIILVVGAIYSLFESKSN
jgi:hypothetical protein